MKRLLTLIVAVTAISGSGATFSTDDRAIFHVLGRAAFGARPGDVERVRNMGIQRYLDEQLRPERINDAGLSARLAGLTTINLSSSRKSRTRRARIRHQAATSRPTRCSCAPTA